MLPLAVASVVAGMPFMAGEAQAFEIEGGDDVRMRFDNTVKYTAAWRLKNADGFVANQDGGQPNTDFGDLGFKKGLINNRLDILSEFDLAYRNVGLRISGAGWYDAEYAGGRNDYPSAAGGLPNYQGGFPAPWRAARTIACPRRRGTSWGGMPSSATPSCMASSNSASRPFRCVPAGTR
ncbi:DUF1302 domain-containing protein [Thauera sinica]|uniref:DUF1302 domain-containing protein n=1 Tax=Thauera sp. K11 TaxID=2005884 RepID=UPI0022B7649A|nr:DUF1302 family protein [Thauera sp. K11]